MKLILLRTYIHLTSGGFLMHALFKQAFSDYIIHFHVYRDYFECHEIMEDAWKQKSQFTKQDPEVALIMLATAMYHLRRHNKRGTHTLLKKTIQLLKINKTFLSEYLDISILIEQITDIQKDLTYYPITLPVIEAIDIKNYYEPTQAIIHKHKLRDRTEVIQARNMALHNKYPIQDTPDDTHQGDKTE